MKDDGELTRAQFRKLKAKWYKKIKADGFEDIEYYEYRGRLQDRVKRSGADLRKNLGVMVDYDVENHDGKYLESIKVASDRYKTTFDYYRFARQLLHYIRFDKKIERQIWALHADGISYRDIASKLGGMSRIIPNQVVKKYRKILFEKIINAEGEDLPSNADKKRGCEGGSSGVKESCPKPDRAARGEGTRDSGESDRETGDSGQDFDFHLQSVQFAH